MVRNGNFYLKILVDCIISGISFKKKIFMSFYLSMLWVYEIFEKYIEWSFEGRSLYIIGWIC